jgi:hypothetical protein
VEVKLNAFNLFIRVVISGNIAPGRFTNRKKITDISSTQAFRPTILRPKQMRNYMEWPLTD